MSQPPTHDESGEQAHSPNLPPSPWRPLRNHLFRNLLLASLVSDIGAFMQGVGASWLMVSLGAGPFYVAQIQTAATLPFFLLALPAGALGDIVDRRRLILVTEYGMLAAAVVLAVMTILGRMSPWLLLALTFAFAVGEASEAPSWRALLPELVKREDLAAASALSGIEFNVARAVGPALAGLLIAATGVGTAFVVNVLSFAGVILVLVRWKRPVNRNTGPTETLGGATRAALRYVRHAPAIRILLWRTGCVMFFASALMALLPSVAQDFSGNSIGYGVLLACFGFGAVVGALVMPRMLAHLSAENLVALAVGTLGATLLAAGTIRTFILLCGFMIVGGAAWLMFISILTTMIQQLAPLWVRARVLAVSMLVFQGSMALGSVVWGVAAQRRGLGFTLVLASVGAIAAIGLRLFARLPNVDVDVSPWNHWRRPAVVGSLGEHLDDGPVLITVEYHVDPEQVATFVNAVHRLGRLRRRDGASRWAVFRDTELPDRYLETFIVNSWAEHLRQHERPIKADRPLEEAVRRAARAAPTVRHFLYASKDQ